MALPVRKSYKGAPVNTTITTGVNDSATTINVASVTGWPTSFPYYAVIDPGTAKEEKVRVTNISTLQLTVVRAQDDTTAVSHDSAAAIYPVFTAIEADEANQIASVMTTKGDIISTDGTTINRLAVGGTNTHVLQVDSTATNGIKWGQVATAGIADNAVTLAKLASALQEFLVPTGSINAWSTNTAPTGWQLCDGTAVSRTTYAALYAVIGTTYGSGDGSTTFNLPNLKGKVIVGRDSAQTEFDTLAETGGAKTVTLSSTEIPSHTHSITHDHGSHTHSIDHDHASFNTASGGTHTHGVFEPNYASTNIQNVADTSIEYSYGGSNQNSSSESHSHAIDVPNFTGTSGSTGVSHTGNSGSTGGGGAHNNLQPYLVLNYIIKN
jgi:microcystin-dependent protein